MSLEIYKVAEAEPVINVEGNMCGTVLRGAVALPGSKATSRAKGSYRNLGGLVFGRQALCERDGPHREGEEPKPMMHGHEKSDSAIVATKPPNKAGRPAAEAVERRAEAKENANRCRTCRTQCRESVSPTPERVRKAEASRQTSEVGAVCIKVHVRFCAGGAQ